MFRSLKVSLPHESAKRNSGGTPLLLRLASRTSMCLRGAADVEKTGGKAATAATAADSSYYPVYLPMDQDFKAKYLWHHRHLSRRGKSVKDRCYLFLEHPTGWICFIYHMSV
jgi:hypothetical protein